MKRSLKNCTGFTVVEMITVLGLIVIVSLVAVLNLRELNDPLQNASAHLASFLKQARAEAIAATSAITIRPETSTRIITLFGSTCSDPDPIEESQFFIEFDDGAYLEDIEWQICFNSKGMPDANIEISLRDTGGSTRVVEVLLGGATRIQ